MKLTLLCKGDGYHFPPCYMLDICGFHILLECPIDLSALKVFAPIDCQAPDAEAIISLARQYSCSDDREQKRRKVDTPLEEKDLIHAEPWFKTVANLHLWDLSFIDVVLISSPMSMLGLPFLTRNKNFSAKVYATEATVRIGKLMMDDLVAMHMEYRHFYGPDGSGFPEWMKWDELELLPNALKEIVMGEDGAMLGGWQPLYSAKDVKDCVQKFNTLKYAEEACHNDTLLLKALSSGLEIGACNWIINGPRRSVTYLSSSMFESAHAMDFEYHSLCGNDIVLFSDFSSSDGINGSGNDASRGDLEKEKLINTDESSEELDKLAFICSCAIESLQRGGSVLIPSGRVGMVLQLLEQISIFLESSNLEVPIFMVSTVAEEMLAYTNIIPEWLCKQRQEKLYSGEALFSHVELIKRKKLQLFPAMHSIDLITSWQEPCIVFAPHWSLRLGPVVHLLRRWHADPNSLLVLEQEVDANLALLPFKPLEMKVLQCSFLSGIKPQKIQPLLDILQPKLVLFPENPKLKPHPSDSSPYTILHYSEGETLRVPSLRNDLEVKLATDLAVQLHLVMMKEENLALARLKGKLVIDHGTFRFGSSTREIPAQSTSVDPNRVLSALCEKGVNGTLNQEGCGIGVIDVCEPGKGSIEMHEKHTVVSADDEILANLLFEVVSGILND